MSIGTRPVDDLALLRLAILDLIDTTDDRLANDPTAEPEGLLGDLLDRLTALVMPATHNPPAPPRLAGPFGIPSTEAPE